MSSQRPTPETAAVRAQRIGGIDETSVTLQRGVNVLEGRNATNRTSFLQAVMAALGSDRASLKADADEGSVELELGDETFTRTLSRTPQGVAATGDPYVEEPELVDLFAFLLESNEARRAVERGDDLRDLIMRPVDTDAIHAEIERLQDRKAELDEELSRIEDKKARLPELEQKKNKLEEKLEAKREELAEKEAEIDEADASVEESRRQQSEFEDALDDLRDARSDLEDVRFDLETERETLDELEDEREEIDEALDELADAPMGEVSELEDRIDRLRAERESLESELSELQNVVQFNEEMLQGGTDALDDLHDEDSEGAVTDQLLEDSNVTCWTCGTTVDRERVESTLDKLRELRQYKLSESEDIESEIQDLVEERNEYQSQQRRRENLQRKLDRTDDEIERRRERVDDLEDQKDELVDRVEELEAEVDGMGSPEYDDLLDLHKEANQLEFEIDRVESDLSDVESQIENIREDVDRADDLREEREEAQERLEDLRTRIDRIETDAVESFNEHMETVLDVLDYGNIERIWIERTTREVREGRRKVERSTFDLHVVRDGDSGVYEDTVDHLSESEREVTGLVFALAGFLVHDVHEEVPFIVLDSLEAIDSERIAALVDYFAEYVDYVVVALLPEDAQALDDDYNYVEAI